MKGIVFTEFIEMVETRFSPEVADRLIDESDLPSGGVYTSVGTYEHGEMVTMIVKLSEISGMAVPDLLQAFGGYLFPRFHTLYPGFFEGIGNALDFMERIESVIHTQVRKLYPDAELPRFDTERASENKLVLTYHSERHMGDLAEGLIRSCIDHFGEPMHLVRENLTTADRGIRFTISRD